MRCTVPQAGGGGGVRVGLVARGSGGDMKLDPRSEGALLQSPAAPTPPHTSISSLPVSCRAMRVTEPQAGGKEGFELGDGCYSYKDLTICTVMPDVTAEQLARDGLPRPIYRSDHKEREEEEDDDDSDAEEQQQQQQQQQGLDDLEDYLGVGVGVGESLYGGGSAASVPGAATARAGGLEEPAGGTPLTL